MGEKFMMREKFMMPALVKSDLLTDWEVFRKYGERKRKKGLVNPSTAELSGH